MTETTSRSPSRPSSESDVGKIKVTRAVWCVLHGALALALRELHSTQDGADLRLPEATLNRFKEGEGHCGGRWSRAACS